MNLVSKEAIKKYISAPCTYVEGRRIFYEEDLDLMGSAFEGMTCGEVIQSIFPSDRPAERSRCCVHYNYMTFLVDFWDSPYQKGE